MVDSFKYVFEDGNMPISQKEHQNVTVMMNFTKEKHSREAVFLDFEKAFDSIGGFHVTQISLIITQVNNKIVYHAIY